MVAALATIWIILWWAAIAAFLLAVVPVVLLIAQGMISHAKQIQHYAGDVGEHCARIADNLEAVTDLSRTRDLVREVAGATARFARSPGRRA